MKYKTIVVSGCIFRVRDTKKNAKELAPILAAEKNKIKEDWNKNRVD